MMYGGYLYHETITTPWVWNTGVPYGTIIRSHVMYKPVTIIVTIIILMNGCKSNKKLAVDEAVDEWFRYPPNQGMYEKVNIDYYVVKDVEEFTRIENELIMCPFFVLDNETSKIIYVRALSYVNNDDNYEFYRFEDNILISNIALTKQTKMKRFILALEYTGEIGEVYVTCGAAQ
jgi:hypothetical protein